MQIAPMLLGSVFLAWTGLTKCVWATLPIQLRTLVVESKFVFCKTNKKTCH